MDGVDPSTPAGIAHIARLSRLTLTSEESAAMVAHMGKILAWVAELNELDTEGVPAGLHDGAQTTLRPDAVHEPLGRDAALQNAPRRDAEGFLVPAVKSES